MESLVLYLDILDEIWGDKESEFACDNTELKAELRFEPRCLNYSAEFIISSSLPNECLFWKVMFIQWYK